MIISVLLAAFVKNDNGNIIGKKGIKIISIKEAIIPSGKKPFSSGDMVEEILNEIEKAREDKNVLGIVLRINSPGGSVGAVQEIYTSLKKFRQEKPLVVSIEDIALSGGYYIASLGNPIFANKGSLVGSIGVIVISFNAKKLLDNIGIKVNVIKSGKHKDILFWGREVSNDEKKMIEDMLEKAHRQFIEDVASARSLSIKYIKPYSDGRLIISEEAIKIKLVDKIGNINEAISYLWKKILKRKGKPIIIKKVKSPIEKVFEKINNIYNNKIPFSNQIKSISIPMFLYMHI
jgi:protease-4